MEEDQHIQQAAEQALQEIARMHENAAQAVWEQYPAPVRKSKHGSGEPFTGIGPSGFALQ